MKNSKTIIQTILLFFIVSFSFAQGITRIPFLELGDKPLRNNQYVQESNGGSFFDSNSLYNEERVKEIVKSQKAEGFKKHDKAIFLLANTNALQSQYPIEAGYTYRIFSIFLLPEGFSILRAKDASGTELAPEVRNEQTGSILNLKLTELVLKDIICTESKNLILENGMMSDRTLYYATTYLIFKKKT